MSFQIETERLIIRDIVEEDIPVLLAQYGEPEAKSNILSNQSDETHNQKNIEASMSWAKRPRREYYKLSVVLKTDRTLIGSCGISNVRPKCFETYIGWHYGHQYRGKGYATEAARELLCIGFELNKVGEIYADCFEGNKASIRVMEKIGMHRHRDLGLLNIIRGWTYGEHKPTIRHLISRHQWSAARKSTSQLNRFRGY